MIILKKGVNIDVYLKLMNFNFDLSSVENFYIENKKRYIIYSEGVLEHKGFRHNIRRDELLSDIKSRIRNKRLNNILK